MTSMLFSVMFPLSAISVNMPLTVKMILNITFYYGRVKLNKSLAQQSGKTATKSKHIVKSSVLFFIN